MQYATCNMQYVICNMQYVVCNTQYLVCNMQYAICNMQYTSDAKVQWLGSTSVDDWLGLMCNPYSTCSTALQTGSISGKKVATTASPPRSGLSHSTMVGWWGSLGVGREYARAAMYGAVRHTHCMMRTIEHRKPEVCGPRLNLNIYERHVLFRGDT